MTHETADARAARLGGFAERYRRWRRYGPNPVLLKELRGRFRGARAFNTITAFLILLASLAFVVLAFSSDGFFGGTGMSGLRGGSGRAWAGRGLYTVVVTAESLFVILVAPTLTMGAVSAESERKTLELLLATPLSGDAIILGKLGAAMAYLSLIAFSALPVLALSFLYGGVSLPELLGDQLLILGAGLFFAALAAFYSAVTQRTGRALTLTFATVIGLAMLRWMLAILSWGLWLTTGLVASPSALSGRDGLYQTFATEAMRYLNALPSLTSVFGSAVMGISGMIAPWASVLQALLLVGYWLLLSLLLCIVAGARLRGTGRRTQRRIERTVVAIWLWNIGAALASVPLGRGMLAGFGAVSGGAPGFGLGVAVPGSLAQLPAYQHLLAAGLGAAVPVFPLLIWLAARAFLPTSPRPRPPLRGGLAQGSGS